MRKVLPFLLAASGVSLLSMVDPALADSVADTSGAADRVILEAGEIDSSRVPTGSYVVVIHGQGERHPVSGEWEQLFTSRGYVHAVDAEVLTLFRRMGWRTGVDCSGSYPNAGPTRVALPEGGRGGQ